MLSFMQCRCRSFRAELAPKRLLRVNAGTTWGYRGSIEAVHRRLRASGRSFERTAGVRNPLHADQYRDAGRSHRINMQELASSEITLLRRRHGGPERAALPLSP